MDKKEKILEFIRDELLDDDEEQINDETSLFKDRILDSLNLLTLISFLEDEFEIKINSSEVNYDNLDSVVNITDYLDRKTS